MHGRKGRGAHLRVAWMLRGEAPMKAEACKHVAQSASKSIFCFLSSACTPASHAGERSKMVTPRQKHTLEAVASVNMLASWAHVPRRRRQGPRSQHSLRPSCRVVPMQKHGGSLLVCFVALDGLPLDATGLNRHFAPLCPILGHILDFLNPE